MPAATSIYADPVQELRRSPPPKAQVVPDGAGDQVYRPAHYQGDGLEAIEVIDDWLGDPGVHLGNAIKYVLRAGKKPGQPGARDLEKALWYVNRARSQVLGRIRHTRPIAAWLRDDVPRIDHRRVVVAFDLDEDLATALFGIGCVLRGSALTDHWFRLASDSLQRAIGARLGPASAAGGV